MMVVSMIGGAVPAPAKDPGVKQAEEQMRFGYKAARRGYWQEALERFEVADELTPNQARILNNIAVALEANGRFDEARTTYRAALALDPGNSPVRRNLERFEEFYASHVAVEETVEDGTSEASSGEEHDDER
jgi:tetratricopeptide (TPR) repeat protein